MNQPIHLISAPASRWTTERLIGVGFVGLLHLVAIYAIVTGLVPKITRIIQPDLVVTMDPVKDKPLAPVTQPKLPDVPATPMEELTPMPVFVIADDASHMTVPQTSDRVASIAPDTAASSISSTHTTPPYPGIARKMGEQGTVKLRLAISAQGVITGADVVQSSGFPDLDQTAVDWVVGHWKYRPAVKGGVAVASTALAAVVFNLKTSG